MTGVYVPYYFFRDAFVAPYQVGAKCFVVMKRYEPIRAALIFIAEAGESFVPDGVGSLHRQLMG